MSHRAARFSIGAILVGLVASVIWFDQGRAVPLLCPWLLVVLGSAALLEYLAMNRHRLPASIRHATFACGMLIVLGPLVTHLALVEVPVATILLAGLLTSLFVLALTALARSWHAGVVEDLMPAVGNGLLGFFCITLPMALMVDALFRFEAGVLWIAVVVAGCKLNDIGGYVLGSSLPARWKHALSPGVSSAKSWEGAAFGFLLCCGGLLVLRSCIPAVHAATEPGPFLLFAGMLAVAAQLSDLFESAVKRSAGTKDSARLLPAFGGVFDIVDSFTFGAPLGYLFGALWLA